MLTKLIATALLTVVVVGAAMLAAPQPANCLWCGSLRCYSQGDCLEGCVCVATRGSVSGQCLEGVE